MLLKGVLHRDAKSSVITDYNRFFTGSVTVRFQSKTDRLTIGFIYKKTDKKTDQLIIYSKTKNVSFINFIENIIKNYDFSVYIYSILIFEIIRKFIFYASIT